jgi:Fe-S cluster assembly ATP-binding protein
MLLDIKNLHVNVGSKNVLKGLNLKIKEGEIHAIMGPNGAGKSTLSKVLIGYPGYEVTEGSVNFEVNLKPENLFAMEPERRAQEGLFLAWQYPVDVPGVTNLALLHRAFNSICRYQGVAELDEDAFKIYATKKIIALAMDPLFLDRPVNAGLSGGEKKKNEIIQMALLSPRLAVLDETDSGLDIDALRVVADGILKIKKAKTSILLITHYQRLLDYLKPDFVHVLADGKIVETGGPELALKLEKSGYSWLS